MSFQTPNEDQADLVPQGDKPYNKSYSDWRYYAIPFFPLSHNGAYMSMRNGGRFLIEEYAEYKDTIQDFLKWTDIEETRNPLYGDAYEMEVLAILEMDKFFHKNGNFRAFDVDGYLKLIIDCCFKYLNIDDRALLSVTSSKIAIDQLPYKEVRYSASPVWDKKGGNVIIAIRTVPIMRSTDIGRFSEHLANAKMFPDYIEPPINYNRKKKEQARLAAKAEKKARRGK